MQFSMRLTPHMGSIASTSRAIVDGFALDGASFLSSVAYGQVFLALPYLAKKMDASSTQVGLIGGLYQGLYLAAVLAGRPLLDRMDGCRQAALGSVALAVCAAGFAWTHSIHAVLACVGVYGVALSWLWPPVMGRISAGLEGVKLNRRLGRFNASWSGGMILGPVLGGHLYEWHAGAPFLLAGAYHLASAALLASCSKAGPADLTRLTSTSAAPSSGDSGELPQQTRVFRRMARWALVSGYLALGLLRLQLPRLAEERFGIKASEFGLVGTLLNLTMSAGFIGLGLDAWWHYRAWALRVFQIGLAGALLLAPLARNASVLYVCAGLSGMMVSFLYASHLFYGVSTGVNRSRLMAVHEILVSVGFLLGSFGGGVIADVWGLNTPYWIGAAAIVGGMVSTILIRARSRTGDAAPGGSTVRA